MIGREYIEVKYDNDKYLSIKVRNHNTGGITFINSATFTLFKEPVEQAKLVENIEFENYKIGEQAILKVFCSCNML
jgi:hypothetical protein